MKKGTADYQYYFNTLKNQIFWHFTILFPRMMKWSFDNYYFFTQEYMIPDFAVEDMGKILDIGREDKNKYIPFDYN